MADEAAGASFEGDPPIAAVSSVLRDRRELALVAFERTRMPIVVADAQQPDAPIVLANQAFFDLTGYGTDEVIGRNCRFLQGPATDPNDVAAIREGLAARRDIEIELFNYRKDGTGFWNQLAISPIVDENDVLLYYFASQKDVSAQRRAQEAERAERLLLMEVDHRAMNVLALVQSFVRLGRAESVEAYALSVQLRVDALARAHRLLAQNGWSSAALGDLIAMEIPDKVSNRIAAGGPVLALAAHVVQPMALALHELMTNALAHGALSQPGGKVEIGWTTEDGKTALRWHESGAQPIGVGHVEGLGLGLVRGVVERQLNGKVLLDWTDDGLRALLSFAPGGAPRYAGRGGTASSFRSTVSAGCQR